MPFNIGQMYGFIRKVNILCFIRLISSNWTTWRIGWVLPFHPTGPSRLISHSKDKFSYLLTLLTLVIYTSTVLSYWYRSKNTNFCTFNFNISFNFIKVVTSSINYSVLINKKCFSCFNCSTRVQDWCIVPKPYDPHVYRI